MRLLLLGAALLAALPAATQPRLGVDVGAALPLMELGEGHRAGLSATLSTEVGARDRGPGLRAEVSWQRLPGSAPDADGDFTAWSARGTFLYVASEAFASPYGLVGLGAYGLQDESYANPYGLLSGAHLGVGLRVPTGPALLVVETQAVVLLTDYGSGAFKGPTTYIPVTVGVRF